VQGWTLNYEMFFYLVFGAPLLVRQRVAVLGVILCELVALGAILRPDGPVAVTYTSPLLLEFLAGTVIGRASLPGTSPAARREGPVSGSALRCSRLRP
jgi:exopolysaccharide production protein ExoZ